MENSRLQADQAAASDKIARLQKDLSKAEAERKDGINKIQAMHAEMRELRRSLEEFEANKAAELKKLEASLTKSLTANKQMTESVEKEKRLLQEMENAKSNLEEEMEKLRIDNRKLEAEVKEHLKNINLKKGV